MMASQSQGSRLISTPKISTLKSKKAVPKLYQSSLHDFIKRKPKTKRGRVQKENEGIHAVSTLVKRKQSDVKQHGAVGTMYKKQKICDTRTRNHGLTERQAKGSGDDLTSPIIISDSQEVISWDGTTVWDSAISSRTLHDDSEWSTPRTSKSRATKNANTTWTTDSSRPFKTPVLPVSQRRSYERILAPDTPSPGNDLDLDDNPFLDAPRRRNPLKPFCSMEVIPSSQSQELEGRGTVDEINRNFPGASMRNVIAHLASPPLRSVTKDSSYDHQQCRPKLEDFIPSSQSQHLLPYKASPVRSAPHNNDGLDSSMVVPTEIIPSSQILGEQELKVPFSYRRGESKFGLLFENSNSSESQAPAPIFKEPTLKIQSSGLCDNDTPTMPQRNSTVTQEHLASASFSAEQCRATTTTLLSNKASSSSDVYHAPSSLRQMESLSFSMTTFSPPPMASSQYSYRSSDSSYPPELHDFLEMFDEDRHSLGSIFQDASLSQSPVIEASQREDNLLDSVPSRSLPYMVHGSSPEPPLDLSESISTQALRNGRDSQYTSFEESCTSVVADFLDMLDQDRGDLDSQFRDLCDR